LNKKLTIEEIKSNIDGFNMDLPIATIAEAFKIARSKQEGFGAKSEEFLLLESFKKKLTDHIRANTKKPKPEIEYEATPEFGEPE